MNRLQHAEFTRPRVALWCVALLGTASLLAWFPTLRTPILVAEDHHFFDLYKGGYLQGLDRSFEWYGVWRILGLSLVGFTLNLHPLAYPVLALLTHLATVFVFVSVCSRLLGDRRTAVGLGLVLAAWPLGYQALVWGVCYPFILSSLILWVQVWVIVSHGDVVEKQFSTFVVLGLLTMLGALSNECLLGAALGTCAWVWLRGPSLSFRGLGRDMKTYYAGWGPIAGATAYVTAYYAFQPGFVLKEPGIFNPRSLLSAYYHTTTALAVFRAWASPLIRDLGFDSWSLGETAPAVALVVALAALVVYGLPRIPAKSGGTPDFFRVGATIVCLLLGASLIYAIGGGFSPESRKLYPICYVMALAAGFVLVHVSAHRIVRAAMVALVVTCSIPTVWLLTGLWQFEAARCRALAQTIAENEIRSAIEIDTTSDPYEEWPYLVRSYGFRLHDPWALNYTLGYVFPNYGGAIPEEAVEQPAILRYDRSDGWFVVSKKGVRPD